MTSVSKLHPFRTHTCGELRLNNAGITARLSGWVHRKRAHGNLLFIDLRDHYGLTQAVIEADSSNFQLAEGLRPESVISQSLRKARKLSPLSSNASKSSNSKIAPSVFAWKQKKYPDILRGARTVRSVHFF